MRSLSVKYSVRKNQPNSTFQQSKDSTFKEVETIPDNSTIIDDVNTSNEIGWLQKLVHGFKWYKDNNLRQLNEEQNRNHNKIKNTTKYNIENIVKKNNYEDKIIVKKNTIIQRNQNYIKDKFRKKKYKIQDRKKKVIEKNKYEEIKYKNIEKQNNIKKEMFQKNNNNNNKKIVKELKPQTIEIVEIRDYNDEKQYGRIKRNISLEHQKKNLKERQTQNTIDTEQTRAERVEKFKIFVESKIENARLSECHDKKGKQIERSKKIQRRLNMSSRFKIPFLAVNQSTITSNSNDKLNKTYQYQKPFSERHWEIKNEDSEDSKVEGYKNASYFEEYKNQSFEGYFNKNSKYWKKQMNSQNSQKSIILEANEIDENNEQSPRFKTIINDSESKITHKACEDLFREIFKHLDMNKLGVINAQNCQIEFLSEELLCWLGTILNKVKYQGLKFMENEFIRQCKYIVQNLNFQKIYNMMLIHVRQINHRHNKYLQLQTLRSEQVSTNRKQNDSKRSSCNSIIIQKYEIIQSVKEDRNIQDRNKEQLLKNNELNQKIRNHIAVNQINKSNIQMKSRECILNRKYRNAVNYSVNNNRLGGTEYQRKYELNRLELLNEKLAFHLKNNSIRYNSKFQQIVKK